MTHENFKYLSNRTVSQKDKAFNIARNSKYNRYQRGLACMFYKFFDKKFAGIANKFMQIKELSNQLHKPIIRKFKKRKVYSPFKYII